jgi:hypothetical protein
VGPNAGESKAGRPWRVLGQAIRVLAGTPTPEAGLACMCGLRPST